MVAPTATIEVYVDGTRLPSTPGELAAGQVTALDNLRLTWGRDGPNEQPGPASVVLELVDPGGGSDVLDVLHVGSAVAVWAEGHIPGAGDPGLDQTMDDGTLDTYPAGDLDASLYGAVAPAATTDARVGAYPGRGQVVTVVPYTGAGAPSLTLPPRRYSPTGELPNAWDDIPRYRTADGPWSLSVDVLAPAGLRFTLGWVAYTNPYHLSGHSYLGTGTYTGTGGWQTITKPTVDTAGMDDHWLGAYLTFGQGGTLPLVTWAQQAGSWADQTTTWETHQQIAVDTVVVARPADTATARRVLVFSGEISDLSVGPWGDRTSTGITVTAVDLGGQLGQTVVGDTPWAVQTVGVRADRVAQLAGITTTPRVRVDTPLQALQLSARDVDAQPAYQLLQDVAQSAGGVLWAATHAVTGPFLWVENPANRAAVRQLELSGGLIIITTATRGTTMLSACDLLEDGVTWAQDSGDVVSVVAVTWAEQGPPGDDGLPTVTERTVTVTDTAAVATYGTRRLSISTELISAADATGYANRVLVQARAVGWRLDGLTLDTGAGLADQLTSVDDATRQTALLDLLDGTTRMGAALTLVDMPPYAPRGAISAVYVDGGTYSYTGDAWSLQLATTPAAGQGSSVTWAQLDPTWRWNQWSPTIQWQDLYGVAP